ANREAVACLEQALTALGHPPESRERTEQAIDVRFDLGNALYPLAEFGRIAECLREAELLARRLDDQRRLGWVWGSLGRHRLITGGHVAEVRRFAETVEAIGERLGDVPLQVAGYYYLTHVCHISGDYHGAERVSIRLKELLRDDRSRERFNLAVFPA